MEKEEKYNDLDERECIAEASKKKGVWCVIIVNWILALVNYFAPIISIVEFGIGIVLLNSKINEKTDKVKQINKKVLGACMVIMSNVANIPFKYIDTLCVGPTYRHPNFTVPLLISGIFIPAILGGLYKMILKKGKTKMTTLNYITVIGWILAIILIEVPIIIICRNSDIMLYYH